MTTHERGERVLCAAQDNAATEPEDDQSGETDPYEDAHDEVSWQGIQELKA